MVVISHQGEKRLVGYGRHQSLKKEEDGHWSCLSWKREDGHGSCPQSLKGSTSVFEEDGHGRHR